MMNLNTFSSLVVVTVLYGIIGCTQETNEIPSIENFKALGTIPFSQINWTSSNQEERGKMVYDLLKNSDFIGKKRADVVSVLGQPTSYYDYNEYPAYVVGPKTVSSEYADGYVLAFITDHVSGEITNYEIVPKIE